MAVSAGSSPQISRAMRGEKRSCPWSAPVVARCEPAASVGGGWRRIKGASRRWTRSPGATLDARKPQSLRPPSAADPVFFAHGSLVAGLAAFGGSPRLSAGSSYNLADILVREMPHSVVRRSLHRFAPASLFALGAHRIEPAVESGFAPRVFHRRETLFDVRCPSTSLGYGEPGASASRWTSGWPRSGPSVC